MSSDSQERRQDYPQLKEDIAYTKEKVDEIYKLLNGDLAAGGEKKGLVAMVMEDHSFITSIKGTAKTIGVTALCTAVTAFVIFILAKLGVSSPKE